MNTLDEFRSINSDKVIHEITEPSFYKYGEIKHKYDITELTEYFDKKISIPENGNFYKTSNPDIEDLDVIKKLSKDVFAGMPTQSGECAGHSNTMSAVEYHQCSELNVFFTDTIMVLAKRKDIVDNKIDLSKENETYFVPRGSIIEFYNDTLHYAPIEVTTQGAKILVTLIKGTNEPLPKYFITKNKRIVQKNKFQIVHSSREDKIKKGVLSGITGPLLSFTPINI